MFRTVACPNILFTASLIDAWTDTLIQAFGLMTPLRLRGNTHRGNLRFQASHHCYWA